MLAAGGGLLIGAGAVTNYRRAQQPEKQMSDHTLANIEALAAGGMETENWANGPGVNVSCARCNSIHVHCMGTDPGTRCIPISCLLK